VETLERLELRGNSRGEGADCYVTDIAEKVLDTDLFCFLGLDE
jgi:hypothetical protein